MKFLNILFLLMLVPSVFAQQTPKELLDIYRRDYYGTIKKRHELFLLEYNKTRLEDYLKVYSFNTKKINEKSERFESLSTKWREVNRTAYDNNYELPLLSSMKVELDNIRHSIQESTVDLGLLADAYKLACEEETIGWMNERFLPTSIYKIPHYQFTGEGASNNLNVTFQMNYTANFGESAGQESGVSTTGAGAQLGDGSNDATAYAAGGMVIGVAACSATGVGVAVAQVCGLVGMAIGTAVGSMISSGKRLRAMNKAIDELKDTYHEINSILTKGHSDLDKIHEENVYQICKRIFHGNAQEVLPVTYEKSKSILSLVNNDYEVINREWDDIKSHHQEKFSNHQVFLKLVEDGYSINTETVLEKMTDDMVTLNQKLKTFYVSQIAPKLSDYDREDVFQEDKMISFHIEGEALFNRTQYQQPLWEPVAQKLKSVMVGE